MLKTKKPVSKPKPAAAVKATAVKDASTLTEVKQLYKFMIWFLNYSFKVPTLPILLLKF